MKKSIQSWLCEPLPRDVKHSLERLRLAKDVQHIAVMPDVHLSHNVCIGTVIGTSQTLYPAAIGGDIGCGIAAMAFKGEAEAIKALAPQTLELLNELIPGSKQIKAKPLPEELEAKCLSHKRLESLKKREGQLQFGTLGRGNHFLELQGDEQGQLWLLVHSGSRAMGPAVRDLHTLRDPMQGLAANSPQGMNYLLDHNWCQDYARLNREAMMSAAAAILGHLFGLSPDFTTYLDCSHNLLRRERHGSRQLWVHRKGAIPAGPGERGIIPGSMGSITYMTQGQGNAESLCSSSHGAGRRMSRSQARKTFNHKVLAQQMQGIYFDKERSQSLLEEAPRAYKDLNKVMKAQKALTRIIGVHKPVLNYKACSSKS